MNLTLTRHSYTADVTLGKLVVGGLELCTLEEPWSADPDGPGGQKRTSTLRESCVEDGQYVLYPHSGQIQKNVWVLVNESLGVYRYPYDIPMGQKWGRASILIHSGNTVDDILGCIVVGLSHGKLNGKEAVLESRVALNKLRAVLGTNVHHLDIRPAEGLKGTGI